MRGASRRDALHARKVLKGAVGQPPDRRPASAASHRRKPSWCSFRLKTGRSLRRTPEPDRRQPRAPLRSASVQGENRRRGRLDPRTPPDPSRTARGDPRSRHRQAAPSAGSPPAYKRPGDFVFANTLGPGSTTATLAKPSATRSNTPVQRRRPALAPLAPPRLRLAAHLQGPERRLPLPPARTHQRTSRSRSTPTCFERADHGAAARDAIEAGYVAMGGSRGAAG